MKRKIISALAVISLVFCMVSPTSISAAESEASVEINAINLAFMEKTHVIVNLTESGVSEGTQTGIAVWYDETLDAGSLKIETANYTNFDKKTDGKGVKYFMAHGVASDEYADEFYVAPVIKNGDNIEIAGTPGIFSVVMYLNERLSEDVITDNQAALYERMLTHGLVASKAFNGEYSYGVVRTKNGAVGEQNAKLGAGNVGAVLTIKAEATNESGESFIYWLSPDGTQISEAEKQITVTDCGEFTYTAVYGTLE